MGIFFRGVETYNYSIVGFGKVSHPKIPHGRRFVNKVRGADALGLPNTRAPVLSLGLLFRHVVTGEQLKPGRRLLLIGYINIRCPLVD